MPSTAPPLPKDRTAKRVIVLGAGMSGFGIAARDAVLAAAGLLTREAVPGLINGVLMIGLAGLAVLYGRGIVVRVATLRSLRLVICRAADAASFGVPSPSSTLRSCARAARARTPNSQSLKKTPGRSNPSKIVLAS